MRASLDLPSALRNLLQEERLELEAPPERRIFTNRDLNFESIPVIGFDMDYTLAIYRQAELERISIDCTVDKLIARGYPEAVREADADPRFAIRGLLVDRKLGNLIKVDRHGYVGRAYHGRQQLSREQRRATYRAQRLGKERERFAPVDSLFALPEVTLFAQVVDLLDQQATTFVGRDRPSYADAWLDVRECIDEAHRDGSIKDRIRVDAGRYIEFDPDLAATLHKFRSAGKRLFLLTNSLLGYTDAVLSYLLGSSSPSYPDWTAYFDWIIVGSRKPEFFTQNRGFQELDRDERPLGTPKAVPQRGKIYLEGNQIGLQEALGVHADQVLYVGDHIYGDIVRSKRTSGWRTAMIVQELEHDISVRTDWALPLEEIENLYTLRSRLAEDIAAQRHLGRMLGRLGREDMLRAGVNEAESTTMLEDARVRIRRRTDRLRQYHDEIDDILVRRRGEVDDAFNPYWGSLFAERFDTSRFGSQLEFYACIYTSRVSNFLFASPSHYFHSPHGSLPHWNAGR